MNNYNRLVKVNALKTKQQQKKTVVITEFDEMQVFRSKLNSEAVRTTERAGMVLNLWTEQLLQ